MLRSLGPTTPLVGNELNRVSRSRHSPARHGGNPALRRGAPFHKSLSAAEQQRADVARARRRWMREQGMFDPARLVLIDETSANTKMVRLYGRCARGERLVGHVPQGHGKTITFVAALTIDGTPGAPSMPCSIATAWSGASAGRAGAPAVTPLSEGAWCADFKGEFKLGNGHYCNPLTVTDHASRFLSCARPSNRPAKAWPLPPSNNLSAERGLPTPTAPTTASHFASPNAFVQSLQALSLVAAPRCLNRAHQARKAAIERPP
jgi:hypothetical protein